MGESPLTSVAALPTKDGSGCQLVVTSKDGLTRCLAVQYGGKKGGSSVASSSGPVTTLRGLEALRAVETASLNDDGTLLASAGWDQEVNVWNADSLFSSVDEVAVGGKRRAAGSVEGPKPKFSLKGHTQAVTSLQFGARARYPFTLFSASWDCSVRVWDVAAASCVCNWSVGRAATSLSTSPGMPAQMVTSHEDGHVSLWDLRAAPHASVEGAVSLDASSGSQLASAQQPHRRMASQVQWNPEDVHRIASVGHDGHLCVIDPRSPKMPLQTLRVGREGIVPTKLLCMAWLGRDMLVVGGSDGKVVRINVGDSKPKDDDE